jgi:hypothetical protein
MKHDLFKQAGYRYNSYRMLYFNREAKKAFSLEFVQDHDENELSKRIQEHSAPNGWRFYFNSSPPESVRRQLESDLG